MATETHHFYLANQSPDFIPGGASSYINDDGEALNARLLSPVPAGSAGNATVTDTSDDTSWYMLLGQWVSYPASGPGTLEVAHEAVIAFRESSAAANINPVLTIWVTQGDSPNARGGTAVNRSYGGDEIDTTATGIHLSPTGTVGSESPVDFQAGDRIVVEIVARATTASTTPYDATVYFGGTSSTDLSDGSTNTSRPAWIDLDVTSDVPVTFDLPAPVDKDADDSASGADSAAVAVFVPQTASDSATGTDSAVAGQPITGTDTGTTDEAVSMAGEIALVDPQQGVEDVLIDAALDAGTDTATASDAAHIVIPADDEAGDGGWSYHVDADLGLTEPGTGGDGASIETLFGDLVISLYAVDAATGAFTPLPDFASLTLSAERNARGSIELHYPATGRNFDLLRECVTDSRDLEVEIWSIGSQLGALRGYLQEAAGDDTEEGAVWTFGGGFLELRMDEAVVFPQDIGSLITDPDTGEQAYSNAKRELILNADTPGAAMATLMQQADDRGALAGITYDFTTEVDSNGTAWSQLITAKFPAGSTYTQILDKLVELGAAEWSVVWDGTDRVLKLWEPEGRGVDRTTGNRPIILRKSRNLLSAPRKWSVRDAVTTMLAAGQEGVYDDATDETALARRDRRIEGYSSLGNASDEAAVLAWAQQQLTVRAPGVTEVTHGLGFLPGEPRPLIAFDVGDWIYSQVDNVRERLRVVQWTLTVDAESQPSGTVTLNDTMTNAIVRIQRRLNQIAAGEVVVGASETPSNNEPDTTPPAAPEGLVASSIAYQDPSVGPGQTLAMVSAGWNPVTTNADGSDDPRVQAAVYIREKLEQEIENPEVPDPEKEDGGPDYDPIQEDWTWRDCPQIVADFNDVLLEMYAADGSPNQIAWLGDFIDEQTQTPTAADDIAGYRVRYSYLGLEQVGGIPSSDPFPEQDRVYYEATPPGGTSGTEFSFGGIEGGSRLRIEVAALDNAGNQGAWSSISHDTSNDATAPPVPSAPTGLKVTFRTLIVPWDGLGSEGEAMPVDLAYARVWVGQGASFTLPAEVGEPTLFNPAEPTPQYVAQLPLGAGVAAVQGLSYGVGWYAALQTVDHSGNASELSAVVGPVTAEQLFSDDLRNEIINDPNMIASATIGTAHIVEASIIGALIAEATIEEAHIATVNAGSITAGTMEATVTVSGGFWTSLDTDDSRLCFTGQGLQLYRAKSGGGSDLIGEWRTSDGSMLMTGTYRSGLSGQRIHIDPDGTMSFYAQAGANPSRIINEGNDVVWRGPTSGGASGRLNVNAVGVGINYGDEDDIPESQAEFLVLDRQTRTTAPYMNFIVDKRKTSPVGGVASGRRIQFSTIDSGGSFIPESGISYMIDPSTDAGGMVGNDAGWKLDRNADNAGRFMVTNGTMTGFGVAQATAWDGPCSQELKEEIEDARALIDPLQTIAAARSRKFKFTDRGDDDRTYVGVIAEELPEVLQRPITMPGGGQTIGADLNSLIGVLWGAFGQVLDLEIVSASGNVVLQKSQLGPGGTFAAGASVETQVTWDSAPPAVPTGGFVQLNSSFVWAGRLTAWIKTGSVTATGCTVVFKNISNGSVVVNENSDALRVSATAIGLGLYFPPYVPPEESP